MTDFQTFFRTLRLMKLFATNDTVSIENAHNVDTNYMENENASEINLPSMQRICSKSAIFRGKSTFMPQRKNASLETY